MTHEEQQQERLNRFVDRVLLGQDGYPPGGWHDFHGDTGKTAVVWSCCHWRMARNGRATVVVPLAEPYDYAQVCEWSQVDPRLVIWTKKNRDLLKYALAWVKSGLVGQVILEGLGFLFGSGKLYDELLYALGPLESLYELTAFAKQNDVALYSTSYRVTNPTGGIVKEHVLGGQILLDLTVQRRLSIVPQGYRLRAGRRSGEFLSIANFLDIPTREVRLEIPYLQGPCRLRSTPTRLDPRHEVAEPYMPVEPVLSPNEMLRQLSHATSRQRGLE